MAPERSQGQGGQGGQGRRGTGRGSGRGRGRQAGGGDGRIGPGGFCVCPQCGHKEVHLRGVPCMQVRCPQCGHTMLREQTPT